MKEFLLKVLEVIKLFTILVLYSVAAVAVIIFGAGLITWILMNPHISFPLFLLTVAIIAVFKKGG